MLGQLLAHTSTYSIGSLLVTAASFISFPILTRLFSVDEYGILSLIAATLTLLVGIAKLGIPHSLVRFYAEIDKGQRGTTKQQYFSTVLLGMAGTGLVTAVLWAVLSQMIPASWWNSAAVPGLLLVTAVLVFIRVVSSGLAKYLRAQQRSALYSLYAVLRKYTELGVILGTVFFLVSGLVGFYMATIAAELLAITVLGWIIIRCTSISVRAFDPQLFRAMLAFGIPMIAYEMGGILLNVGDRYVIQAMLGTADLGIYAAAYNLCDYVQIIFVASVGQAIVPMFVSIWEEQGEAETKRFIERSLHFYLLVGAALVAGLTAVGAESLSVLASEKYREGHRIVVYVMAALVIDGAGTIFGAGLYIFKQTRLMMWLVVGCALLNIALNLVLIPWLRIEGAAVATLVSYGVLMAMMHRLGSQQLAVTFPIRACIKFAAMASIMYVSVVQIQIAPPMLGLVVKIATGVVVYSGLALALDQPVRDMALNMLVRQAFCIKSLGHAWYSMAGEREICLETQGVCLRKRG